MPKRKHIESNKQKRAALVSCMLFAFMWFMILSLGGSLGSKQGQEINFYIYLISFFLCIFADSKEARGLVSVPITKRCITI